WLACTFADGICTRFDDGTLVRQLDVGMIKPLPPRASFSPPAFAAIELPKHIAVVDGQRQTLPLTVRNSGGQAFGIWIRMIPDDPESNQASTEAIFYPIAGDRIALANAAAEFSPTVEIVAVARENNPVPVTANFRIMLQHAYGEQDLGRVAVELK